MKYCLKCGAELEDNAIACGKCGDTTIPAQPVVLKQPAKISVIAILSFILSIVGFLTGLLNIGIFFDIVAIILAVVALIGSKRKPIKKWLPISGIIIAALSLILMTMIHGSGFVTSLIRVNEVEKMINNIGQVTVDSKTAIDEIETKYDNLTDEEKAKVDNYAALEQIKNDYREVLKQDMINKAEPLTIETLIEIKNEISKNRLRAEEIYNGKFVSYTGSVIGIGDGWIITGCYPDTEFIENNSVDHVVENINDMVYVIDVSCPYEDLTDLNEGIDNMFSCVGVLDITDLCTASSNDIYNNVSITNAFLIDNQN